MAKKIQDEGSNETGNKGIPDEPTQAANEVPATPIETLPEVPVAAQEVVTESTQAKPDYMTTINKAKLYKYIWRVIQGKLGGMEGRAGIGMAAEIFGASNTAEFWATVIAEREA